MVVVAVAVVAVVAVLLLLSLVIVVVAISQSVLVFLLLDERGRAWTRSVAPLWRCHFAVAIVIGCYCALFHRSSSFVACVFVIYSALLV